MPSTPVEPLFDDSTNLSDSTYEIISSVDGESQDGRHSESLADSLEMYPQGDDVRSLGANTPTYDDDTESESEDGVTNEDDAEGEDDIAAVEQSRSNSIQYAESSLENPSRFEDFTLTGSAEPMVGSIVFAEVDGTARHDKVVGKYPVKVYSEQETAEVAKTMRMENPPKQFDASVCQTMSSHLLSVSEPLRLLFVGSDAGRIDIMHKISSAILASDTASRLRRNSDGKFNIVPISSFGSDKVPEADEIQLMGVSDYYINVCRCVSANEIFPEGASHHDDATYSIKTEAGETYTSSGNLYLPGGSIQPEWSLPHLAIFYLSGSDYEEAEKTTHAAWEFMTRHGVPSLFISHTTMQPTLKAWRWQNFIDQGAIHTCLESTNENDGSSAVRWPIDLASFMSIDARQMNRNLAYLTGHFEESKQMQSHKPRTLGGTMLEQLCHMARETRQTKAATEKRAKGAPINGSFKDYMRAAIGAFGLVNFILVLLTSILMGVLVPGMLNRVTPASTNRELITTTTITPTCAVPTLIPTVTINVVSTKTVHLGVDETTHVFGGFLSDKAAPSMPKRRPEPKKVSCSIEMHSGNEVLVNIPSKKSKSLIAAGAIDIDVWRGKRMLEIKLSDVDRGIIIEIPKKDAFGVMNVSVVARNPKINETVAINFGPSPFAEAYESGTTMFHDAMKKVFETSEEALKPVAEAFQAFDDTCYSLADSWRHSTQAWSDQMKEARDVARKAAREAYVKAKPEKLSKTVQDAQARIHRAQEEVVDSFDITLRRAQFASKLWWLKAKGDDTEHKRYEQKAREFMDKKERMVEKKRATLKDKAKAAKTRKQLEKSCSKGCGQRRTIPSSNWARLW